MVTISNLEFNYSSRNLFKKLSLTLESGKIYGLLGKNGAGKTTLLKLICGLLFPNKGKIEVIGLIPQKREASFLENIYFIPETYYLPDMPIKKYLALMAPFYHAFDKDLFYQKLEALEIKKNESLHKMSYGQKKKFLLAFGIATNCPLLIFDEPTNGLDIPSQQIIRKILSEILLTERTLIISTHHVREMENLFNNLIILDNGEIIFNKELQQVAAKLSIKLLPSIDGRNDIIYMEKIAGGYIVLIPNDGEETKLDLEFLFNALIKESAKLNKLFE